MWWVSRRRLAVLAGAVACCAAGHAPAVAAAKSLGDEPAADSRPPTQYAQAATYSSPAWWPLRGSNKVGCARNSPGPICEGDYHSWWAIDVEGAEGQNVYASGSGIAELHTDPGCDGYGRYVVVDHGLYGRSLYGHLSAFSVADGAQVTRHTLIGKIGHSGAVSGCRYDHLHYEETAGSFGTGARDPGQLKACHGNTLVSYPSDWDQPSWNGLPAHTLWADSDGTNCGDDPPTNDTDDDGVVDSADDCPTRDGPASNQGCPDLAGAPELTLAARSVVSGDFNGDAYQDLAVGAPGEDIGGAVNAGAVLVDYGGPGGLGSAGKQQLYSGAGLGNSAETGDYVGAALAVGDFNRDGRDDLAIGAPGEDSSAANGGLVLTIMGSPAGLDPATAGGGRQGNFFGNDDETGDYLGAALTAGDFNGDGYDDLAAGAPGENSSQNNSGIVLTINGSPSGLDPAIAGGGRQGSFFANDDEDGDYLGAALAAGDFNRDGYDDLAAGAPGENSLGIDGGIVLTIRGSSNGLNPATAGGGRQGTLFGNSDESGDFLGAALTAADFNGDGYDDLAAGAPGEDSSAVDGGIVFTVNGSAGGLNAATAGGGRQGGLFANDDETGDYLGAALSAGDFNGDGYDDLAAGAPGENSAAVDGGIVLTVHGSAGGLDASSAGGGRQGGFFANTDESGDYLGAALASGDFNGDCVDDLAASAPGENSAAVDGGVVLTIDGSVAGLNPVTAGGGRQGGFFAGADEAGDYLGGGANGANAPPSHSNPGTAEPPSGNQNPVAQPLPRCREVPIPQGQQPPLSTTDTTSDPAAPTTPVAVPESRVTGASSAMTIDRGRRRLSRSGVAQFRLRCAVTSTQPCVGTLRVRTVMVRYRGRSRRLEVGVARFTIAPGRHKLVRVKASATVRRLLGSRRTVTAVATATAAGTSGQRVAATVRFTLSAPARSQARRR